MTDFLNNILSQSLNLSASIEPRPRSRFEPFVDLNTQMNPIKWNDNGFRDNYLYSELASLSKLFISELHPGSEFTTDVQGDLGDVSSPDRVPVSGAPITREKPLTDIHVVVQEPSEQEDLSDLGSLPSVITPSTVGTDVFPISGDREAVNYILPGNKDNQELQAAQTNNQSSLRNAQQIANRVIETQGEHPLKTHPSMLPTEHHQNSKTLANDPENIQTNRSIVESVFYKTQPEVMFSTQPVIPRSADLPISNPERPHKPISRESPEHETTISSLRSLEKEIPTGCDQVNPLQPLYPKITTIPTYSRINAESAGQKNVTIQVTIGRIEVRAESPSKTPQKKEPSKPPVMSLDEYLRERSEGGKR